MAKKKTKKSIICVQASYQPSVFIFYYLNKSHFKVHLLFLLQILMPVGSCSQYTAVWMHLKVSFNCSTWVHNFKQWYLKVSFNSSAWVHNYKQWYLKVSFNYSAYFLHIGRLGNKQRLKSWFHMLCLIFMFL